MDVPTYLREVVTHLSQTIGPRPWHDPVRLERSVRYISVQLASFGYRVDIQPFHCDGNTYQNVIAELPGKAEPERIVVVGAHYDTVDTTPGADDNASGIAGVLTLARDFANRPLGKTVRFVAFPLEEPPFFRSSNMGSYRYAERLSEKGEHIEGMICLEMIGYFCDEPGCQGYPLPFMDWKYPQSGNYVSLVGNLASKEFTEIVARGFRAGTDLPTVLLNAPPVFIGIDFSDHWSFYQFGFPALMVTDTAFYRNPHYHMPTDLSQTLDYERMAKVVAGLKAALEAVGDIKCGIRNAG